jgi:hypothetical protein
MAVFSMSENKGTNLEVRILNLKGIKAKTDYFKDFFTNSGKQEWNK